MFGAPQAHENDPERAIQAALDIRDAAHALGMEVTAGINTGEAYVGVVGSTLYQTRSVIGSVINMAARLQGQSKPGEILVGESTYRHARRAFEFTPRRVNLKGFEGAVPAYVVDRAFGRPDRVRGIEGRQARLVGRRTELTCLQAALTQTLGGNGQIVSLIGEAGLGKSRLALEFQTTPPPEVENWPPRWCDGRAFEFGLAGAYGLFIDLLQGVFNLGSQATDISRASRIHAVLSELIEDGCLDENIVDDVSVALGRLLGARFGDDRDGRWTNANPQQVRHQIFLAVRDLCVALARRRPLALILEDLHWADSVSLDLIEFLFDSVREAPILLLCVYRPEREHRCCQLAEIASRKYADRYVEIRLEELTSDQGTRMVEELFDDAEVPAAIKALIVEKARGNPFYVEEVVRSLIEGREVFEEDGIWRVNPEVLAARVPDSIQGVILSRVDRLPAEPKRLLERAAVIGRVFRTRLLGLVEPDRSDLEATLRQLVEHGLVYRERIVPEEEYSFKHVLIQETIYNTVLLKRRTVLHQRVGEAMERLYADNLGDVVETLAYHFGRTGLDEKAVTYLCRAGEKAERAYVNEEAIDYFSRARSRLAAISAPEWAAWRESVAGKVFEGRAETLARAGRFDESREQYREALANLSPDDSLRSARLYRKYSTTLLEQRKDFENAHAALDDALRSLGSTPSAEDLRWWEEWVQIHYIRMCVFYWENKPARMIELRNEVKPAIERHGTALQLALFYNTMSMAAMRGERYRISDEAVEYAVLARDCGRQAGDDVELCHLEFSLGFTLLFKGDLDAAWTQLQTGLALAERTGQASRVWLCLTYLTVAARLRGNLEETLRYADRSLEAATAGGAQFYIGAALANRGWVKWRNGDAEGAKECCVAALKSWQTIYMFQWTALFPLLGLALAEGDPSGAVDHARALLDPGMQRLPEELESALRNVVDAADPSASLQRLCALARQANYL